MTDTVTDQMSHRYAYRVLSCQAVVSQKDGLLTNTSIDFHPDCKKRYSETTPAIEVFEGMQTHVFTGTAPKP
jgi:hypothetical protein